MINLIFIKKSYTQEYYVKHHKLGKTTFSRIIKIYFSLSNYF
jgi:hypothetical protein